MDASRSLEAITSSARLQILADVSHAFAMVATDYASLLDRIATITASLVGDGCTVTLVEGERLVNAANAHRDPVIEVAYREYLAGIGITTTSSPSISASVVRTGEPAFVAEVDPAALVERSEPALKELVARLDVHSFVVVPIHAHGAVIGTLSIMRSGPGHNYVPEDILLLQDLADRAGLAIDNARLYRELELRVRQRTAELEVFTKAVAQNLRSPLRAISAFGDALHEDGDSLLDDRNREHLQRIRTAATRANDTVDSLLHLAKLADTEFRREQVDLSALVEALVNRQRVSNPMRPVDARVEPGMQITADQRLVELALATLLASSFRSTRPRSPGSIEVSMDRQKAPFEIVVRDSRFEQPDEQGLGESIVRQVVERHGGTLHLTADEGGTTYRFSLSAA